MPELRTASFVSGLSSRILHLPRSPFPWLSRSSPVKNPAHGLVCQSGRGTLCSFLSRNQSQGWIRNADSQASRTSLADRDHVSNSYPCRMSLTIRYKQLECSCLLLLQLSYLDRE